MRTAKIPLLIVVYLFSNVGFGGIFGNIFGKKKDDSKVDQVEKEVIEDDFDAPSVEILGNTYPVNKIDLPAETIYENHTREELISLLGEVLNLSSLEREEDTLEDSYRKYFAAVIGTAHLLEGYSSALITSGSRIVGGPGREKRDISFTYKFRESEARRSIVISSNILYPYTPRNFYSLVLDYSSAMGYRKFVKDFSANSVSYFREENRERNDLKEQLEETDKYLLSYLIKNLYFHWNKINSRILSQMPPMPICDYVAKWRCTHNQFINNAELKNNVLVKTFMQEVYRFAKFDNQSKCE